MDSELIAKPNNSNWFVNLFRVRAMEQVESKMAKVLGLFNLYFLAVGGTIGAGAYSTMGLVGAKTGPAIIVTMAFTGFTCLFTALPYAEFTARCPTAGSSYAFVYASSGELLGFIIGWFLNLYFCISGAAIARAWASYFGGFFDNIGVYIPDYLYDHSLIGNDIIIVGFCYVDSKNYEGFFDKGAQNIMHGCVLGFFSFLGFDTAACFTEEAKNPTRDVPRVVFMALGTAIVFNCLAGFVVVGLAPGEVIDTASGMMDAFNHQHCHWMTYIVIIGSFMGLTACTLASLLGQPRIWYCMAHDGMLPKFLAKVSRKSQVPVYATFMSGAIAALCALFFNVDFLGSAISLGCLQAYALADLGVVILRYSDPTKSNVTMYVLMFVYCIVSLLTGLAFNLGWHILCFFGFGLIICSAFKCPWMPIIPMLGTFFNFFICGNSDLRSWVALLVFMGLGLFIYIFYSYKNSEIGRINAGLPPSNWDESEDEMEEKRMVGSRAFSLTEAQFLLEQRTASEAQKLDVVESDSNEELDKV